MFLRVAKRNKDGKTHRYWSVVESRRERSGRVRQRQVLYLGELNDAQHAGWVRAVEAFEGKAGTARQLALFPDDREALPGLECEAVHIRIDGIRLSRPRQWGGCWLALWLWDLLALDDFWRERLAPSRKKTRWLNVLKTLTVYRLLSPGSEWRLHREWFAQTAMADLLGEDAAVAQKNTLYRCLDKLLDYRDDMFGFLRDRWSALFDAKFDVLLYDLTSTYFEANPPAQDGLKKHGYSRDHRPDCVQVVIALVVTPDGFPLAYEVMPGNTADSSTLREFLELIEKRHGKIHRTWLMDRGIPTEETLEQMRSDGVGYLVGTPKGRLSKLEARLLDRGWEQAREEVRVKLLGEGDEFYVYVESRARVFKERSMRRRRLKKLWRRLHELKAMKQTRDQLLLRLGAAKKDAGRAWRFLHVTIPGKNEAVTPETFCFELNKPRLREARRREGRYLLRSNLTAESPEFIWEKYLLLTRIEQAFKDLKSDLSIRPIYHQGDERIKAHIFVCFLAYCLQATLKNLARGHAGGLTPRSILEKFNRMQMIDVHLPTTDDRTVVLHRHTEPDAETRLLLAKLHLTLPAQPPPRVHPTGEIAM